jgi:hypothetical protein
VPKGTHGISVSLIIRHRGEIAAREVPSSTRLLLAQLWKAHESRAYIVYSTLRFVRRNRLLFIIGW